MSEKGVAEMATRTAPAVAASFLLVEPSSSAAETQNKLQDLARVVTKPWVLHVSATTSAPPIGRLDVTARDGTSAAQIVETMTKLARAHGFHGFAPLETAGAMAKVRAAAAAGKACSATTRPVLLKPNVKCDAVTYLNSLMDEYIVQTGTNVDGTSLPNMLR